MNLKEGGQDYNYLYDGKGNVMVVIDNNQQPVSYYRYDVFGVPMKKVGTINQPFRFSTKRYDELTGLSYYGYRFYSPITGRWMTRDPLGEAGGINLYGFVGNNAVNAIDPLGELAFFWHYWITFAASKNSGYSWKESANLAKYAMLVDFEFYNPGTQGTSWECTRQHGMSGRLPNGRYQTAEQSINATKAYIHEGISSGNLAGAIHAAQDLATPLHVGQEWKKFEWSSWNTYKHIYEDVDPTLSTIRRAYQGTKDILNNRY